jgi:8-oxo-dGTP diphosphatase
MSATHLPKELEDVLMEDELENISMLGFFRDHRPTRILTRNKSFMVQGLSDELWWYVACKSIDDFIWFLRESKESIRFIATINDSMLLKVKQHFAPRWVLTTERLYLPASIEVKKTSDMELGPLGAKDAEYIFSHSLYKTYTSVKYIRDQIASGYSSAYFDNGMLVGWAITHDDGALGMLHVLREHRRKGIARMLMIDLIEKVRRDGLTPFTYVEPDNTASMNLMESLGFAHDRRVHWVSLP